MSQQRILRAPPVLLLEFVRPVGEPRVAVDLDIDLEVPSLPVMHLAAVVYEQEDCKGRPGIPACVVDREGDIGIMM